MTDLFNSGDFNFIDGFLDCSENFSDSDLDFIGDEDSIYWIFSECVDCKSEYSIFDKGDGEGVKKVDFDGN